LVQSTRLGAAVAELGLHFLEDHRMKTPRNLGLVAVVVFVISHFLPAYGDGSGFACFRVCWNMLLGHDTEIFSAGWFYYSGFAISNILFIGLMVAMFVTKKSRRLRSVVSVVFFLHVVSWLVLHICQQPPQVSEIKIGYYVWLIAYGLLVAAHLGKEPGESLESIPLARSVV
jgi:hypothetical protein